MVPDRRRDWSRRDLLRAGAAALPLALAGCSSSCPDDDPPDPSTVLDTSDDPAGALAASAVRAPWPTYRHDAHNTGFGADTRPPGESPALAWRTTVAAGPTDPDVGGLPSAPTLADGTLYVVAGDGTLHALDARDGTERWQVEATPAHQAPTVADGTVVVAGEDGVVVVDVAAERVRWRADLAATASAVTGDGRAFVPVDDALVALDSAGDEDWRATFDGPVTRPAVVGETVLAAGARVRALDTSDGTERWQGGPGGVSAFPVVDGERELVYFGTYDGLYAFDLATGEQAWLFERGSGRGFDSPVVAPGTLYAMELVGEGPDAVYALDPDTGDPEPRWCSWLGEGTVSAAGPDTVLVETQHGDLQSFERETGDATWQLQGNGRTRAPALGAGAAFVTTTDGTVCALGPGGDGA
ncbi:MAG: PQQ-binding-like beta-propeller repeat protein [Haloarculaceae archaeon]